jgi:hypothetical protein
MTSAPTRRRRGAVFPPGRITLRRRVRPVGDQVTRRIWAQRFDLKRRQRGDSMPVYHACCRRVEERGPEIAGTDVPVRD